MNSAAAESARDAILDAAEVLFAEKGFAGASMRALAGAAGVSQALIHHHFGTKRGLHDAVKCRFADRFTASTAPALMGGEGDPPGAKLLEGIFRYADWLDANPNYRRMAMWAHLEGDFEPMGPDDQTRELHVQSRALLADLQTEGLLRPDLDPDLFLLFVAGIVEHWMHQRELICTFLDPDESIESIQKRYLEQAISVMLQGALPAGVTTPIGAPNPCDSETKR